MSFFGGVRWGVVGLALMFAGGGCPKRSTGAGQRSDGPRGRYQRFLAARGVRGATIREAKSLQVGRYRFFGIEVPGHAMGAPRHRTAVSPEGALDDPGVAHGLLLAAKPEIIARRLAWLAGARRLLLPNEPVPNTRIDPKVWALIRAPRVSRDPAGVVRLVAWFGDPPGFYPVRMTYVARPTGRMKVSSRSGTSWVTARSGGGASLLESLKSRDISRVRWAIQKARRDKDRRAAPALIALLAHGRKFVRSSAAIALGAMSARSAVLPLVRALGTERDVYVRSMFIRALNHIRDARALPHLGRILMGARAPDVWSEAIDALAAFGAPARKYLEKAANTHPHAAARARKALNRLAK